MHESEELLDDLGDAAIELPLRRDLLQVLHRPRGFDARDFEDLPAGDRDEPQVVAQRPRPEFVAVPIEENPEVVFGHVGSVEEDQDDEVHRTIAVEAADRLAGGPERVEVAGAALEVRYETGEGGGGAQGGGAD